MAWFRSGGLAQGGEGSDQGFVISQYVFTFSGREATPDTVRLVRQQGMVATTIEHRTLCAVLFGLQFTAVLDGTAFGVRWEEDLRINAAADSVVLPFPVGNHRCG